MTENQKRLEPHQSVDNTNEIPKKANPMKTAEEIDALFRVNEEFYRQKTELSLDWRLRQYKFIQSDARADLLADKNKLEQQVQQLREALNKCLLRLRALGTCSMTDKEWHYLDTTITDCESALSTPPPTQQWIRKEEVEADKSRLEERVKVLEEALKVVQAGLGVNYDRVSRALGGTYCAYFSTAEVKQIEEALNPPTP